MINNLELVLPFAPATPDGDTFIYTELLNRNRKGGNNKGRLMRTFYHRSQAELREQMPDIIFWCDFTGARAYTRLSPRSFRKVGMVFAMHVMEQVLAANWEGMRHGYNHCCGISKPTEKFWIWDVDLPLGPGWEGHPDHLKARPEYVCTIPSRSGYHIITRPWDVRAFNNGPITLHKDNPTNLYIPE